MFLGPHGERRLQMQEWRTPRHDLLGPWQGEKGLLMAECAITVCQGEEVASGQKGAVEERAVSPGPSTVNTLFCPL